MLLIIDFGSQYTQLIARRIRELNVYSEIYPPISLEKIKGLKPEGIIFSGGPASVFDIKSPKITKEIFNLEIPILGICYGMQLIVDLLGGQVLKSEKREYGKTEIELLKDSDLFSGLPKRFNVWMSHGDRVVSIPDDFSQIAKTENTNFAGIANIKKNILGVQFHPEVTHTQFGTEIIKNFLFKICKAKPNWTMKSFLEEQIKILKEKTAGGRAICALSGGVDSTVCGVVAKKAFKKNFLGIFVDNGLLRQNEPENIKKFFKKIFQKQVIFVDAKNKFLNALGGITDPEQKRKIIGKTFIEVFEKTVNKFGNFNFLIQGTLYPDVIESQSFFGGPSAKIKSHHNVGGLPQKMNLKILEPLKTLFKDEVRKLAKLLKIPNEIITRHPFPGPGLAIRIIGKVTIEKLNILRQADKIIQDEIELAIKHHQLNDIWQAFGVLLPVKTVGVQGDFRTYSYTLALRVVNSLDGMTADWVKVPYNVLEKISQRITNEVPNINRVVYDITTKPPATIEWE